MILHEKISAQLPAWRERIKSLAKEHAEVKVDDVTVGQIVGGMRDIKSMLLIFHLLILQKVFVSAACPSLNY